MSQTDPVKTPELKRRTVLRLVVLTVLGTLVGWYVNALITFAGNTYSYNNRFTEVAKTKHWFYLVWSNVEVLRGYFLVACIFTLIVYPLVLLWLRVQRFGRWGVVWRSLLICGILYGFFIFRLMMDRPYFGDYSYFDLGWKKFGDWFGSTVQHAFSLFVLTIFPWIALVVCGIFYAVEIGRALRRNPRLIPWPMIAPLALLTLLVVSGYGFIKEQPRPVEVPDKPKPKPKNILILASDSLRADHLSCNGYIRPTSPNIDALAAQGVNFQRCFTPIASTLESLTTMFSGQYPHTHGIVHMFPNKEMVSRANANMPGLAKVLKEKGYDTAVIGDWCACGFHELPMGFQDIIVSDFDNFKLYMSEVVYLHHQILPLFFDNRVGHWLFPKLKSFANYMTPDVVTSQVIERLQNREADDRPFVIFAFYSCTHLPYKTPREYAELWSDPAYNGRHKHQLDLNVDEFIGSVDINSKWEKLPRKEVEQIIALYDGDTRMFDDCVGHVTKALDATKLKDDTIVMITGDHGDDLFEPNTTFGHGLTFNGGDQNNNIPFIMRIPGHDRPGAKVQQIVRSIDFAPTLLELTGHAVDPKFEGKSLVPALQDASARLDLPWFGETSYLFFRRRIPGEEPLYIPAMDETTTIDPEFDFHFVLKDKYQEDVVRTKERCLRTDRFKLIYTPGVNGPIYRLFDTVEDVHCERDVKTKFPKVFDQMRTALLRWMESHKETPVKEIFAGEDEHAIKPAN